MEAHTHWGLGILGHGCGQAPREAAAIGAAVGVDAVTDGSVEEADTTDPGSVNSTRGTIQIEERETEAANLCS